MLLVDPPYLGIGNALYAQGMSISDHQRLATALRAVDAPWLLTYDQHPLVPALYPNERIIDWTLPHTAHTSKVGHEYMVLSDRLWVGMDQTTPAAGSTVEWVRFIDPGLPPGTLNPMGRSQDAPPLAP